MSNGPDLTRIQHECDLYRRLLELGRRDQPEQFLREALALIVEVAEAKQGYLELYDGARRHWDNWEAPAVPWTKGTGPCSREEAERRARGHG